MFDMGEFGFYIWGSYGLSAVTLAGVTLWTLAGWRAANRKLSALEPRAPRKETKT